MDGFAFFDAIYHIRSARPPDAPDQRQERFRRLGIADRVTPVPAVSTPGDPRIGAVLTHRRIVQAASEQGAASVLVLNEDVLFLDRAREILAAATAELRPRPWALCHLGGWWPKVPEWEPGCRHLGRAREVSRIHAVAYSSTIHARLLADWPADTTAVADWLGWQGDLDRYLGGIGGAFVVQPVVTTVPALLPFEAAAAQRHFTL